MLDWLKEADMATRLESAIARVIGEGKVRTYEQHVRSPRRHGLAVARAAKIPRSTWPKPSPITPVHKSRDTHSYNIRPPKHASNKTNPPPDIPTHQIPEISTHHSRASRRGIYRRLATRGARENFRHEDPSCPARCEARIDRDR